jgi:hypothetical protein
MKRLLRVIIGVITGAAVGGVVALVVAFLAYPQRLWREYPSAHARLEMAEQNAREITWQTHPARRAAALFLLGMEDRRMLDRSFELRGTTWTNPLDLHGIGRALFRDVKSHGWVQGGSSLAVQVARLMLPHEVRTTKTIGRKLLEARLALDLVHEPPDRIVETFLNVMPCAALGMDGFEQCGWYVFGKGPADLNAREAMYVAALVRAPGIFAERPDLAKDRLERGVGVLNQLGWISPGEADALRALPLEPGRHPELARAARAGEDVALTQALAAGVAVAREKVLQGEPAVAKDLSVAGAIWCPDGELVATTADAYRLHTNIEAGSWAKPFFLDAALRTAGLGEAYLAGASIPLRVSLWDQQLRRYKPRNAGSNNHYPQRATPIEYTMISSNTGVLAAALYAGDWMKPADLDAAMKLTMTPAEIAKRSSRRDRKLEAEQLSDYAGMAIDLDEVGAVGYRALALWAVRLTVADIRRTVPAVAVTHEDLAALLGAGIEAPWSSWARAYGQLWFQSDGVPSRLNELMRARADEGTLRASVPALGLFPYKTKTAGASVGLMAGVDLPPGSRCRSGVLSLIALRPSGEAFRKVQGATLQGGMVEALTRAWRAPTQLAVTP